MQAFLSEDFLLTTAAARAQYRDYEWENQF